MTARIACRVPAGNANVKEFWPYAIMARHSIEELLDGTAFPVDKCVRGAFHRLGAPPVPRSCHRVERCRSPEISKLVRRLLHDFAVRVSLKKDSPERRPVTPRGNGRVIAIPQVGGLHHRYERRAA